MQQFFGKLKLRRYRKIGVALLLSALASIAGLVLYSLPKNTLPIANRIADFVFVNDALFWARDQTWLEKAGVHFPDVDEDNEQLRLIAIDEHSLDDPKNGGIGQWPWPRAVHGHMLERLAKAGARVVAFDVTFVDNAAVHANDVAFAAGMKKVPTALPYTLGITEGGILAQEPIAPDLVPYAATSGFTTVDNPGGWLVGQHLTINTFDDKGKPLDTYTSIAGATVSYFTKQKITNLDPWQATIGDTVVPLDGEGYFLMLPFKTREYENFDAAQRAGSTTETMAFAQQLSYADALNKLSDADLKTFVDGRIVMIGTTAQAMGDFILTPNGRYPGVFSNLRFMDQLLDHKFIWRVPPAVDVILIILLPLLIGTAVTQLRPSVGIGIAVVAVFAYAAFAICLYGFTLHWIDLIHVNAAMLGAALFVALYRVITEGADKRAIRDMFGKHVSPAIVDDLLKSDDPKNALNLSGKRAKVTIFYSDIRGFTAMSEKMSAEQIYGQLNEYFEEMCAIVFKYGGYVDKFIGDCLMAVFSAPNPMPDDAYRALASAVEQQQKILEISSEWEKLGKKTFTVGMGLNTGEVMMGNLGSSDRMNYTVIGDNVNTAARLYNVAKGGQIIISEATYYEVKGRFVVNELQPVSVKGKVLPLRNFEVLRKLEPGEPDTSTLLDPNVEHEAFVAADH